MKRELTYDEKIQSKLRQFLWSRFPEFSFEVAKLRIHVTFSRTASSTSRSEWEGDYGDVHFVFRAWQRAGKIVSFRCVAVWQNWLAHEDWSLEREIDIRSRIPYEEELIGLIDEQ
jgi:hypothetical protein